jgi:hypothetical protein
MAAQVLPGEGRVVEVQQVEIGGGHGPWRAGQVFGVGFRHGILLMERNLPQERGGEVALEAT